MSVPLACIAIGVPMLLAFNLPPSATFLNQAMALVGWGSWLTVLASSFNTSRSRMQPRFSGLLTLQAALAMLLLAALASPLWAGPPWAVALSGAGMVGAAALAVQMGATALRNGSAPRVFCALCIGLVVAGVASSLIGIVQVFAPTWPDGDWVAKTYIVGRAVGNMRQPNHLSSLLVWAVIAAVWLGEAGVVRRWASATLALLFVFVIVLSASRTGTVSVGLLAVWALLDRRLSRPARALLLLAPVAYAVFWFGTAAWADYSHHVFGGETRFSTKGDISSSRWGIWSNTLALIRMHPWAGVGFGEFNFAWTLTPFPDRPVAFFDHTHNLVLQFAVELGLPLAALVLGLLGWALYAALQAALRARDDADTRQAPLRRAAFMLVLLILLHSLLEYPLWYAYFLLPAAFAFGLCLGRADEPSTDARTTSGTTRPLLVASMLLMLGGVLSVADYARVVTIFAPADGAPPLAERIASGQRSVFFAYQADYAAATTAENPVDALPAFKRAPHNLLDARLMIAWAKALDASGDTERARYVAQRLKEFRNDGAVEFFAPCDDKPEAGQPLPFQCEPPTRAFGYEDFR